MGKTNPTFIITIHFPHSHSISELLPIHGFSFQSVFLLKFGLVKNARIVVWSLGFRIWEGPTKPRLGEEAKTKKASA